MQISGTYSVNAGAEKEGVKEKHETEVVNATMMPSLLYRCQVWRLTKQQQGRVQATQMSVLINDQGVSRFNRQNEK